MGKYYSVMCKKLFLQFFAYEDTMRRIRHDPGKGTGKAGTQKANRQNCNKATTPRQHFHNACKNGKDGKAHALNEKTYDVDQSQRKIKAGLDQQESPCICDDAILIADRNKSRRYFPAKSRTKKAMIA